MAHGGAAQGAADGQGIGAPMPRKEDDRYMRGRGQYVGDIKLPGMLEVAFLRSPLAHARIRSIRIPDAIRARVLVNADLEGVKPIRADTSLPGFKSSVQPALAVGKVRFVGELIALCAAPSRAEAEDMLSEIEIDFEPLPAVVDMLAARRPESPLVHEPWGDNLFLTTFVDADFEAAKAKAAYSVTKELVTSRQAMCPLEGRGVIAEWSSRKGQLVVTTSTQQPHIVRSGLAECLGLSEEQIRVISPDVGGGFGYKGILLPEEVALGFATRRLGRPLRWLEDRREGLTANANCREHHYLLTAYADADGRLLALDCEATVDSGAYSAYPFSACLEAGQIGSILPGLYDFPHYRCKVHSVATNKPPILPYRGVARTGVCFALEVTLDALARRIGIEPNELRFKSLVQPHQMPFDNIAKRHFDSGDYPKALRMAIEAVGHDAVRARQRRGEPDGRRIGIGYAMYAEQAGHGTSVYAAWGIPFVPGFEQAQARFTPDGGLELRIGAHSHGQGMETTLSQVAHEILGVPHDRIRLVHGDTGETPYSTGTWGSRSMIMSGGAVGAACDALAERVMSIGAALLQARRPDVRLEKGFVVGPSSRISVGDIARTWYRRPQDLPPDVDPGGLELTAGYKARRDTGTFSYAAHAAVVAVDPETGEVEILDYVVVEDGGVLVNPLIVDGQVYGGCAQGIGTALYEEMAFDANGQPQGSTLSDYMLPGPGEVPDVRILHLETPSPYTRWGQKGVGEGGAIAPPAAITNAVNDALKDLGAELAISPITPRRVVAALDQAGKGKAA
ncbi:MAG: xanthine dehydrogenase family protein molybdopterin-binding subunit [Hyphomicrobiaceae bacterium]|nr:xanthine dehydrogenase family protein molybdopterin-binding subunit [Hyphomicrobiaceae bacterium]